MPGGDHGTNSDGGPRPRGHNLAPFKWKPGQSGNPSGRPKNHRTMRERLKKICETPAKDFPMAAEILTRLGVKAEDIDTMDVGDLFALTTFINGLKGKQPAIVCELLARLDGKVPQIVRDERLNTERLHELLDEKFAGDPRAEEIKRVLAEEQEQTRVALEYD